MTIESAVPSDFELLSHLDRHTKPAVLTEKIDRKEILVAREGELIGYLRFGYFWDNTPFLNLLFVLEERRGRGVGAALVRAWEAAMAAGGYREVLTSTLASEGAQHFYRKLGYVDIGGFILPGEPLELILRKALA